MSGSRHRARSLAPLLVAIATAAALVLVPASPASAHSPHDQIPSVAVTGDFSADGGVGFAISRERLLRTTDGGETWTRITRGITTAAQLSNVAIAPTDPDRLLVGSRGGGAFRSDDGGLTWEAASDGLQPDLAWVAISPQDPDLAFASGAYGTNLYRTTDGGARWADTGIAAAASIAFAERRDQVLVGDLAGQLHASDDAGATFAAPQRITEGADVPVRALAIDDRADGQPAQVLAGTDGEGLLVSDDGGATFAPGGAVGDDDRIRDLVLSPADEATTFATTWAGGVCRSDDRAATWTCTDEGLTTNRQADELPTNLPQFGELALDDTATSMLLAGYDGLFRSTDGGATWAELETQGPMNVAALAVVAGAEGEPPTVVLTHYLNGVQVSTDGGETWEERDAGLASAYDWELREDYLARLVETDASPSFAEDQTLFSSQRGYVSRSTDGGRTWQPTVLPGIANEQDQPPDYAAIAISPAFADDGTVLLGTNRGKAFRTSDGGDTWEALDPLDGEVIALVLSPDFGTDRTAVVATVGGVQITTDAGDSWTPIPGPAIDATTPTSLAISPTFADDGRIWLGTDVGLYEATDVEAGFAPVDAEGLPGGAAIEAVVAAPGDDPLLLASLRGLGLFRSTDGGGSFEAIAPELIDDQLQFTNWYHSTSEPIAFSPDFATDRTIWGYAEDHLLRSTDGGETWTEVERPVATHDTDPDAAPAPLLSLPEPGTEGDVGGSTTAESSGRDEGGSLPTLAIVGAGAALVLVVVAGGAAWRRRRVRRP